MRRIKGEKLHYAQVYPKLDLINIKHGQNLVGLHSSSSALYTKTFIWNHICWRIITLWSLELVNWWRRIIKISKTRVLPPTVVIVGWSLNLSAGNMIEEESLQCNQSFIPERKILLFNLYHELTSLLLHWSLGHKSVCQLQHFQMADLEQCFLTCIWYIYGPWRMTLNVCGDPLTLRFAPLSGHSFLLTNSLVHERL